jgi:hypothetical protein
VEPTWSTPLLGRELEREPDAFGNGTQEPEGNGSSSTQGRSVTSKCLVETGLCHRRECATEVSHQEDSASLSAGREWKTGLPFPSVGSPPDRVEPVCVPRNLWPKTFSLLLDILLCLCCMNVRMPSRPGAGQALGGPGTVEAQTEDTPMVEHRRLVDARGRLTPRPRDQRPEVE